MLDPAYPLDAARRSGELAWDLDDPSKRDRLHRLVALLADADSAVAERFLRHLVLTARPEPDEPLTVVVGPLAKEPLERLGDEIASLPGLRVRHRLIRSGFCRMDSFADDVEAVCGHLVLVPGVAEVRRIDGTVYVLPYPDLSDGP